VEQNIRAIARKLRTTRGWRVIGFPYRAYGVGRSIARVNFAALRWLFLSREDTNHTGPITELNVQHLAHFIVATTGAPLEDVRTYIAELQDDHKLAAHVIEQSKACYPGLSDYRADYGRRLGWYALVRILKPRIVVETGVDKGLGSVVLTAALLRNGSGRYYGTDLRRDRGKLLSGKYAEAGEILYGDSIETLEQFPHEIDLFINDSDHSADYEYGEYVTIRGKLSERSFIVGDNAHQTDCLMRFSEEAGRRFLFWHEQLVGHWAPGGGIGLSY
jgi:predicted O-methyltransferase YrrM